jgi:dienelactone hydrolase
VRRTWVRASSAVAAALLCLLPGVQVGGAAGAGGTGETLQPTSSPAGAAEPGTDEWYSVDLPDDHVAATLGVYRPSSPNGDSVLILHGKDGPRQLYEELGTRYAAAGFITVVACWFVYPEPEFEDEYECPGVGPFIGAEPVVIDDIDAVVDATRGVRGIRPERLAVVGNSYGARVALLRAAQSDDGEPVVSSCGYLAAEPVAEPEVPRFPFPADPEVAAQIDVDVLVVHGEADPITPIGQAEAFASAMAAAGHPIVLVRYGAPAGHSIPWDVVAAYDQPEHLLEDRFLDDTTSWLLTHLGREDRRS